MRDRDLQATVPSPVNNFKTTRVSITKSYDLRYANLLFFNLYYIEIHGPVAYSQYIVVVHAIEMCDAMLTWDLLR